MSAVVLSALRMTLGIFLDKARRSLRENLKDGDLNSLQLRSLITTKLESIETKLDGIALSPLRTSASFIRDGMFLLNDLVEKMNNRDAQFIDKSRETQTSTLTALVVLSFFDNVVNAASSFFDNAFSYVARCKDWLERSDNDEVDTASAYYSDPGYLGLDKDLARKLIDAVFQLKRDWAQDFDVAMMFFNHAYMKATEVFNNQSLSLQDRVMATKLRIQSRLLLSIGNLDHAKMCKDYLNDLHALPSIVEIFRYELEGGLLSKFNQAERHELFQSVSTISFVLFRFLNSFTWEIVNVYDWPLIESDDWTYNPLIPDKTVLKALRQAEAPNLLFLEQLNDQLEGIDPTLVTVNSKGDLLLFRQRGNPERSELLKVSGSNVEVFYTFPEFTVVSFLSVAEDDFLFVFAGNMSGEIPTGYLEYDVSLFNPDGDICGIYKNVLLLDGSVVLAPTPLLEEECQVALCMPHQGETEIRNEEKIQWGRGLAVRNEKKIQKRMEMRNEEKVQGAVAFQNKEKVQELTNLCIISGKIKMWEDTLATMTDKLRVVAIKRYGYNVRVFEKDGRLVREFELQNGERETCVAITFNSLKKELLVVSRVESDFFLSTYLPETGERRHHVRLAHIGEDCQEIQLTSHSYGSIALVTKEHVLYLQ